MQNLSKSFVFIAMLALVGCGGSNPGGGTKTLFVKATAHSDGSTDGSWLGIEVRDGSESGSLITDAVVTVRGDKEGEFNLPWSGINWGGFKAGLYLKDKMAWDQGWSISVKRGNDNLDAYLVAPGVTTITEPIDGTVFRRGDGQPFTLKWKDGEGRHSDSVKIDFNKADADVDLDEDPMERQIEANRLTATNNETVTVTRSNTIDLAGGTPGSRFTAETTHHISFVVE